MADAQGGQTVRRIALYAPDYHDYIHRLMDGILAYQDEHGGFLLKDCRYHLGDLDDPSKHADPPPWRGIADGVITYVGPQSGLSDWLRLGGAPVVNTSADRAPTDLPCVHSDGRSVSALAADHFLLLGYRSFTYVGLDYSAGSDYREQTFAAALRERGHELRPCRLPIRLDGTVRESSRLLASDRQLLDFLQTAAKPLAVFCQNDRYGAGVCATVRAAGLRVPEDVAVLGVADMSAARESDPPLSSVRVPGEQIGYEAMALLDRLLRGEPATGKPIEVPATEVVVRSSTCRHPARDADIDRAVQMIRDRACDGIDVGDVLDTLHLSRKTFERRFLDATGRPPGEEIRRVRLARAEHLLATTDLSVTRIGRMVGFPRPSMFTRFFKTRTGLTPRGYRRSMLVLR